MMKSKYPEGVYAEVVKGTEDDLEEMFELAKEFFYESSFSRQGLTLNDGLWFDTVRHHINSPHATALCVKVEGKIVAYVLIYYQTDYTVEPIGEMFQFYVSPEFRGTNVPRELVRAADQQWKEWGCARAYCEASPGILMRDHLGLFKNLWGKVGFEQVGVTLMKEF